MFVFICRDFVSFSPFLSLFIPFFLFLLFHFECPYVSKRFLLIEDCPWQFLSYHFIFLSLVLFVLYHFSFRFIYYFILLLFHLLFYFTFVSIFVSAAHTHTLLFQLHDIITH
ncbi:hypothetical protein, conserved [Trypanosoma brucei brucei TREU927]|uniref:T. brucei spp.-specific protein n=1 Tax=Trypanosoma brucei brucei (strain 927/4 GUTat10.1) TaxID=185431 RepID=Q4GYC1_TRYB2|nr:hypothetical protein, conserved [Trypanosoma brucei brucei TREU927]CAJ16663.1 hypothetical protein, conserved [Trypanosoma brucei brucei TREU927]